MDDGMCVIVCVWVCFSLEVGVCFELSFLPESFLSYVCPFCTRRYLNSLQSRLHNHVAVGRQDGLSTL